MLDKQIGHTKVQIRERRRTVKSPLHDDWFGTAVVARKKLWFMSNCEKLEENKEFHVVYEKTQIPSGDFGIRIHDVIT